MSDTSVERAAKDIAGVLRDMFATEMVCHPQRNDGKLQATTTAPANRKCEFLCHRRRSPDRARVP
jgi:hypothetical protein